MEIPQNVQDKLKCSECDELLSCGPVYLLHESGGTICGRCSQQSEESTEINNRTRNEPYEATASLLAFPCAFAARGCTEKISFTLGRPSHESSCAFRPFMCPIAPSGSCDWIGSWPQLKAHCDEKHESNVLENECNLPRPDLTASNLQTYLISAFSFLFLLHVKVCVASGKLFHSVRMFGDSKFIETRSYSLEIEGNDSKVTRKGSVLPSELMVLQEPTANCISINSLLEMLDCKYNEAMFTIKIQTCLSDIVNLISQDGCGPSTNEVRLSVPRNCLKCSENINVNVIDSKYCKKCIKTLVLCDFSAKNCLFVDVSGKCQKHEKYFCEYQTKCCIPQCRVNFVGGSLFEHLSSNYHKIIKSEINSVVRFTQTNSNYVLFSSNDIGTILCGYKFRTSSNDYNSYLYLSLYTSLTSFELTNYKCSIKVTDPRLKHYKILTPSTNYNDCNDWYIRENIDEFPSWENLGLDIEINIDKM